MAVTYDDNRPLNYHEYKGTSLDNKPTTCAVNSIFWELDTNDKYYFNGETWEKIGGTT